jgi:hypothetical protein
MSVPLFAAVVGWDCSNSYYELHEWDHLVHAGILETEEACDRWWQDGA